MRDGPQTSDSSDSGSSSAVDRSRLSTDISTTLQNGRNPDGGWPYHAGKRSRLEATCWALLALGQTDTQPPDLQVLRRWPRSRDGWLTDVAGAPPNHAFNALAALTLLQSVSPDPLTEALVGLVVASEGIRLPSQEAIRQDGSLRAWPWIDGTFSWVEPTAWCVLLLKQRLARGSSADAAQRVRVGEQMLKDRACRDGGWNYGNSNVYGQDLLPYVPTTALALLALQDRRNDAVVMRGLERLQLDTASERSVMALSLAVICLRIHGLPTAGPEEELAKLVSRRRVEPGLNDDFLSLAMALYALTDRPMRALMLAAA